MINPYDNTTSRNVTISFWWIHISFYLYFIWTICYVILYSGAGQMVKETPCWFDNCNTFCFMQLLLDFINRLLICILISEDQGLPQTLKEFQVLHFLLCDFKNLLTVFNQSYNCQTNHYLGRNRLPKPFQILPSLENPNTCSSHLTLQGFLKQFSK